jgi:hypothetical protein
MSKKLTAKSADDAIGSLIGRDTLINGQPFTIVERRHVLIGNAIYYRLRVRTTKTGEPVQIDVPIETNTPAQLALQEEESDASSNNSYHA